MTLQPGQIKQLEAPLDPRRVQTREGSGGKRLSYLLTHDAKRTANRIFGFDGWDYQVDELVHLGTETFKNSKGREGIRVGYRATVTVTAAGARRGDVGYGDSVEYGGSILTPHELAAKEAVSDAVKRCLSSWGDQFGLVLYGADPAPPSEDPRPANRAAHTASQQPRPTAPTPPGGETWPLSVLEISQGDDGKVITKPQQKRLFAIAGKGNVDSSAVKEIIKEITGQDSSAQIPRYLYDRVIQEIELVAAGQVA